MNTAPWSRRQRFHPVRRKISGERLRFRTICKCCAVWNAQKYIHVAESFCLRCWRFTFPLQQTTGLDCECPRRDLKLSLFQCLNVEWKWFWKMKWSLCMCCCWQLGRVECSGFRWSPLTLWNKSLFSDVRLWSFPAPHWCESALLRLPHWSDLCQVKPLLSVCALRSVWGCCLSRNCRLVLTIRMLTYVN